MQVENLQKTPRFEKMNVEKLNIIKALIEYLERKNREIVLLNGNVKHTCSEQKRCLVNLLIQPN